MEPPAGMNRNLLAGHPAESVFVTVNVALNESLEPLCEAGEGAVTVGAPRVHVCAGIVTLTVRPEVPAETALMLMPDSGSEKLLPVRSAESSASLVGK